MRAFGFYPNNKPQLDAILSKFLSRPANVIDYAKGCIVPHAGYAFSGELAATTLATARTHSKKIIILGTNHTGIDTFIDNGSWETPLGAAELDFDLIEKIGIEQHPSDEHSIEVIVPILQKLYSDFSFVPLVVGQADYEELEMIAKDLAELAKNENIFFTASSDFIHYGPNYGFNKFGTGRPAVDAVVKKDNELIELIKKMEPNKFYETVNKENLTVCGFRPITLLLMIMKKLKANNTTLIDHKTSFDVHPDKSFVDYIGMVFN